MDSLTPPNGNAQGYPSTLPVVSGCLNTFSGNVAANAGVTDLDNVDTFGASRAELVGTVCDRLFADDFDGP